MLYKPEHKKVWVCMCFGTHVLGSGWATATRHSYWPICLFKTLTYAVSKAEGHLFRGGMPLNLAQCLSRNLEMAELRVPNT